MLLRLLLLCVAGGVGVAKDLVQDSAEDGMDSPASADGAATAGLQPGAKLPLARTYRTAYGTHFDCASTWKLMLGVHVLLVVGGLLLLSVVPVRFASSARPEAPFVLWFGSPERKSAAKVEGVEAQDRDEKDGDTWERGGEQQRDVKTDGLWQRVTAWLGQSLARLFAPPPGRDFDARYRFHADLTQQLAAASAKSYESIAVSTEDLEETFPQFPPRLRSRLTRQSSPSILRHPEAKGLSKESEVVQSPRRLTRLQSRSSIVTGTLSSPPSMPRMSIGSTAEAGTKSEDRRMSRASSRASVVDTTDDLIREVSRRQSMAARAEKRVVMAKEDVSYENLGDDEIRTYEYIEFVRELLDGLAVKKLCQKSGRIVSRKLYITSDMTVVFWNAIGTFKRLKKKSSVQIGDIQEVLRGIHGSRSVSAKSTPELEALCVSIRRNDGKWLVLQAKTEAMRQRLFFGFSRLAQENQESDTIAATEQTELVIAEVGEEEEVEGNVGRDESQVGETAFRTERKQQGAKSYTRLESTTYESKTQRETQAGISEEHATIEQDIYEEKPPPPPTENIVLRSELVSVRERYDDQVGDEEQ
ncbi:unnamed protein product [Phytophthora fragariaefolia]|uniref:Unnamed protein product n=1 Tax=Phytophthora fragariaefolia TaxID=1490495 RepID=A0A9W6XCP4_9STRA|nr:unnamed protein product [Phytophthora fragariaefolia]